MGVQYYHYDTVVIGSGAAGYNAACQLFKQGITHIAVITNRKEWGTSRNAGSDKQTYYKLSLTGQMEDSPGRMAETLFEGQCVDGDIALTEAALSARCFFHLVESGVPFPTDEYGQFPGYKTDHDPAKRATSAGPYTSRLMTECLEREAMRYEIPVKEGLLPVKLLVRDNQCRGVLCYDLNSEKEADFAVFYSDNIILATGGPASVYKKTVYPVNQQGCSGIAYEAGAAGKNLTEWQFGMGSVIPRWNLSGSYMQVLPRFISTDQQGEDEREFLNDYYRNAWDKLDSVFKKGYQWPFDARKAVYGESSMLDLLVFEEIEHKHRRVFLDYRNNPDGLKVPVNYQEASDEMREYLEQVGVFQETPVERLRFMNEPAYQFYLEHGVDLEQECLELQICAQHNNGGIEVDTNWQSSVKNLYVCGEAACTHGVYRPGGMALNSGQAGSLRAAMKISSEKENGTKAFSNYNFESEINSRTLFASLIHPEKGSNAEIWEDYFRTRMSEVAGPVRNRGQMEVLLAEVESVLSDFFAEVWVNDVKGLGKAYQLYDILVCQRMYLSAYIDYDKRAGGSRGSALYYREDGEVPEGLGECYRFKQEDGVGRDQVQTICLRENKAGAAWRKVRPLPEQEEAFETIWRNFREKQSRRI